MRLFPVLAFSLGSPSHTEVWNDSEELYQRPSSLTCERPFSRSDGGDCLRLSDPDAGDLLAPYPAEVMTMWAVSQRLNTPKNDTPDLLEPTEDVCGAWPAHDATDRANSQDAGREPANSA